MHTSFADLVGTSVVPARCLDDAELSDLAPALDLSAAVHDMAAQAGEASNSIPPSLCYPVNCVVHG